MNSNPTPPVPENPVMLYDGQCVFCNGAAKFVLANEKQATYLFAALQSETGQALCRKFNLPTENFKSFVVINNNRAYRRFEAALQLGYEMGGEMKRLATILDVLVPNFIGNFIYSVLWPCRKIFGSSKECIMPTEDLRKRILDDKLQTVKL